jgi:3-phosphoshikimate 1-carboxyvinyltransferase
MIAKVFPGKLSGAIAAIPSKSHAHRLTICASLADAPTEIFCPATSEDILATARCVSALGARAERTASGFRVGPGPLAPFPTLDCGESGSTYRFMLPVACALGAESRFLLAGRLPDRPMGALFHALAAHGIAVSGEGTNVVEARGKLTGGVFILPGDVSSQFVSGLLMAAPLTGADCEIRLTSPLASRGYVDITLSALRMFGVRAEWKGDWLSVPGGQAYRSPGEARAEGDWSNAAFFLCAAAASGSKVEVSGLDPASPQGDRAVAEIIARFGTPPRGIDVDISDIPDLAPALAVLGAAAEGTTRLLNAGRLRLKESDRVASIVGTLQKLGADIRAEGDRIVIEGGRPLAGGAVDSCGDHRIAMMAACAASLAEGPIEIARAEAVNKSYPGFFDDLRKLGLAAKTEV